MDIFIKSSFKRELLIDIFEIHTTIKEFENKILNLINWLSERKRSFKLTVFFNDINYNSKYECFAIIDGWYPRGFKHDFKFKIIKDYNITNNFEINKIFLKYDLLLIENLDDRIIFDKIEIQDAHNLNIFEKKYGDKLPIPKDIRLKIYEYVTPYYNYKYDNKFSNLKSYLFNSCNSLNYRFLV